MKIIRPFIFFACLGMAFVFQPMITWACSCMPPPSPNQAISQHHAVFSGTVLHRSDSNNDPIFSTADPITYSVRVDRVWKGIDRSAVAVNTARSSASCGVEFGVGEKYLFYATKKDGRLHVNACSRTRPIHDASSDLMALGKGSEPKGMDSPWQNQTHPLPLFTGIGLFIGCLLVIIFYHRTRLRK